MSAPSRGEWRRDPAGKLWRVESFHEGAGLCLGPRALLATSSGFGTLDASVETVSAWPVERVFAVAIAIRYGDCYAAMRSPKRGGKLSLLGGKVEPGEFPGTAARREAREESGEGISVLELRMLGTWVDEDEHLTTAYFASLWYGELRSSPEGPAEWATREALLGPESAYPGWYRKAFAVLDEQKGEEP